MKEPRTKINLTLQATLLSAADNKYLVTSVGDNDLPVALVVDQTTAETLLNFSEFYNKMPDRMLNIVRTKYRAIASAVHMFEEDVTETTPDIPLYMLEPLKLNKTTVMHETTVEDTPVLKFEVECASSQDAFRYFYGVFDEALYNALDYLLTDYQAHTTLYHYVFNKYISKFYKYLEGA